VPKIFILSDIHLSPTHGFFWENWSIARDFANAARPEAVIVNGDLCINGPEENEELAFAAYAVSALAAPVFTTLSLMIAGCSKQAAGFWPA
jgi:hypothetical protein